MTSNEIKDCMDIKGNRHGMGQYWYDSCNKCACTTIGAACAHPFNLCSREANIGESGDQRFRKHECQDENGRRIKVGYMYKKEKECKTCYCTRGGEKCFETHDDWWCTVGRDKINVKNKRSNNKYL